MASPRAMPLRPCQAELCRVVGSPPGRWLGALDTPAQMHPAPSEATQPPLASNLTGFWQIPLHQVLRTGTLLPGRANSKAF